MSKGVIGPAEWAKFRAFATKFYGECMAIAVKVAGETNANTIQILLGKMSPDILELLELWGDIEIQFDAEPAHGS